MSSMDFSNYLRQQMVKLGLNNSDVALRANISRLTWYRLLESGDITEAKISTLVCIAKALDLHLYQLLTLHFNKKHQRYPQSSIPYASGFINDISYPQNSVVALNETFTKIWKVINLGHHDWQDMRLHCADTSNPNTQAVCYKPLYEQTLIPDTKVGESVYISVNITAPSYPCAIISEWEIIDKDNGLPPHAKFAPLNCVVRVV